MGSLLAALLTLAGPASDRGTLDHAFELYKQAEFVRSVSLLDDLYRQSKDAAVRAQAKLYLGMNYLALGNTADAERSFKDLLELDPDYVLSDLISPKVARVFDEVKQRFKVIPRLAHEPPKALDATKPVTIAVRAERMRPGYTLKLFFRVPPAQQFSSADLVPVGPSDYEASLPVALLARDRGYTLDYYAEARAGGELLASLRNAAQPYSAPVTVPIVQKESKPVYKQPWFWPVLVGGLAVVGGAVTTAVLLSQPKTTGDLAVTLSYQPPPARSGP
jgi:hypothetical protein